MARVVLGFLFCALAYPAFVFFGEAPRTFGASLLVAGFTVVGSILLGLPTFVALRRNGWLRWWQFAVGGALLGVVLALPFAVSGLLGYLFFAGAFAALGAVHALVFWAIAVPGNSWLSAAQGEPTIAARSESAA